MTSLIFLRQSCNTILRSSSIVKTFPNAKYHMNHFVMQQENTTNNGTIIPEAIFHKLTDKTLEDLSDSLSILEENVDDIDIAYSQGVLTLNLGPKFKNQTWVLNKQTPNRQIWWSSPISGPRRYEYEGVIPSQGNSISNHQGIILATQWKYSKDSKSDLWGQLQHEILQVVGIDINSHK